VPDLQAPADNRASADGHQLARGAAVNALVLLASNFRGIFTFLIARILGQAALGRFGIVFAFTDLLSKPAMLGYDSGIVPLIAARQAAGDGEGVRKIFRTAVMTAVLLSAGLALATIPLLQWLGTSGGLDAFGGGGTIMLLALPGIALARISTGASRAMLAMGNEFYSRGITETWATTGVFAIAVALGLRDTAPAVAVVAGSAAGGIVAFLLARRVLARLAGSMPAGRPSLGSALRFTTPIAGANLLGILMLQADVLLLGFYVGRAPGVTVEAFGVFCAAAELPAGCGRCVRSSIRFSRRSLRREPSRMIGPC
jgi:O-antigen/teichoic acid export membrane protein